MPDHLLLGRQNPDEALWSHWRRLESQLNVERMLTESGRTACLKNAAAISYCVRQAADLYRSARSTSLLARPILLFYGMVALLKVIALGDGRTPVVVPDLDEIERSGHGVKLAKWPETVPWAPDLEKVTVNKQGHGFYPFIERRINSQDWKKCFGLELTVRELLGLVPELADSFHDYYGANSVCEIGFDAQVWSGGQLGFVLRYEGPPLATEEELFARFPNLRGFVVPQMGYPYNGGILLPIKNPLDIPGLVPRMGGGLSLLIPVHGYYLDRKSVHYLLTYALSIFARYKVDRWGVLLDGKVTGLGYLLYDFMDMTSFQFPRMVLEHLTEKRLDIGNEGDPNGRWSRPTEAIYRDLGHFEEYQNLRNVVLGSTKREERLTAMESLRSYWESGELMRQLVQNEPDPKIRIAALQSNNLRVSYNESARDAVIVCLQSSDDADVKAHAANLLGYCDGESVTPVLRILLDDNSETSLGRLGDVARKAIANIQSDPARGYGRVRLS